MPYRSLALPPLFVLRWTGVMEPDDLRRSNQEVKALYEQSKTRVRVLVLIPAGIPLPPPDVRKLAAQQADSLLATYCDSFSAVLLGDGLILDLVRTMMRGLVILMRNRTRITLHDTVEKALLREFPGQITRTNEMLQRLNREGFLTHRVDAKVA